MQKAHSPGTMQMELRTPIPGDSTRRRCLKHRKPWVQNPLEMELGADTRLGVVDPMRYPRHSMIPFTPI